MTPRPRESSRVNAASPDPRPRRSSVETQRRILDAAEIEFASKGYDGARLGSIARAADAQQALIHHYFDDKAGLYREVITRALDGLSAEGWDILAQVNAASIPPPSPARTSAKKKSAGYKVDVAKLVSDFIASMLRFHATHGRIVSILRHEAHTGGALAAEVVERTTKPVFEAIVALFEKLQRAGEIRRDFDARHMCLSGLAMAAWPFQEHVFVSMVFPTTVHDPRVPRRARAGDRGDDHGADQPRDSRAATVTERARGGARPGSHSRSRFLTSLRRRQLRE